MTIGKTIVTMILSMTLSLGAFAFAQAATRAPLEISDGHLFFAPKRSILFVLADIWPNRDAVESISAGDRDILLVATAVTVARSLLSKSDMELIDAVRVEFSYVKNMDEYARQDFGSMVRHGYVSLVRKGADVTVTENKLDFQPSR